MKKLLQISLVFISMFALSGTSRAGNIKIVPRPAVAETQKGYFRITANTPVIIRENNDTLLSAATVFNGQMQKQAGMRFEIKVSGKKNGSINIYTDPSIGNEEAYVLEIKKNRIDVTGASPKGVFYALQSLRQMVPAEKGVSGYDIPAVIIKDSPAFSYRGVMLDVVRHFFTPDEVKEFIDILALHKINTLHWHLTDDQGWRIQIDKYPLLTEIGSIRSETVIGHGGRKNLTFDGKPYGKYYYTKDEIRDIVDYAGKRFITVIPEVEMPGHATAALAAYPELGCTGGPYEVWTRWGVNDEVFCAGKEETFGFMEDVLDEVLELFPSEYIHVGGDECPKNRWEECPNCQRKIADENLKNEHELQSYFIIRIEKYLNGKGKKLIGWDEILDGGVTRTATIMSWRGASGGIKAAKMGNMAIMVPNNHCYFDYYQSKDTENEPLSIGGHVPVETVYALDPCAGLTEDESKYIMGVQCNLWTEYILDKNHLEYMLLPRLAALAEIGWSYGNTDYDDFKARMDNLRKLYDINGYNYAPHMFVKTEK